MQTYILSDSVVNGFLADLVIRLRNLGSEFPMTWCAVGLSGDKVARQLMALLSDDMKARIDLRRVTYSRTTNEVIEKNPDGAAFPEAVLLIDGPIHSGRTMRKIAKWLLGRGVLDVTSYGLVVKRTSEFVPSFFGVMIGEHDRAYFQFHEIPNHRLRKSGPFGILRKIEAEDAAADVQTLAAGNNSLSTISLSDLWLLKETRGDHVYVYEVRGVVVAYIHFLVKDRSLLVDALATAESHGKRDIGGMMMRWAENWARNHRLLSVDLYSLEERVMWYERLGFSRTSEEPMRLKTETLVRMRRRLLYNIEPDMMQL